VPSAIAARGQVGGVGLQDLALAGDERVGDRVQRGVARARVDPGEDA
jgi:hypothetical protein